MQAVDDRAPTAPVVARGTVEVRAGRRRVWGVLADLEAWPTWNPVMRDVVLDGELEVGSRFRWAGAPVTIRRSLTEVDAPRRLAWDGRTLGVRDTCRWSIAVTPTGTRVSAERRLDGLVARLLGRRLRADTQRDLDAWLELLALEAETREDEAGSDDLEPEATGARVIPRSMPATDPRPAGEAS